MDIKGKNIYLFFSGDFPEGNAKNARIKAIAKNLKSQGADVTLCSFFPSIFNRESHKFSTKRTWNDIPFFYFSGSGQYKSHLLQRIIQRIKGQFYGFLYVIFRLRKIDLVYFYNPRFSDSLITLLLIHVLRKKSLVDITELFSTNGSSIHRLEEYCIAKYSSIKLTVSKKLKSHYVEHLNAKNVFLVPIMVDIERFNKQDIEPKPFQVGYIGSFADKDGVQNLIKACNSLTAVFPEISLKLMGYNPNEDTLKLWINKHVKQLKVHITGKLMYQDIPNELMTCDTLVINRTDTSFANYGFPIKLGEYFATKRPVVCADVKGFAEEFQHGNHMFKYKPDNVEALVDCLKYRYEHEHEAYAVGIRGFDYAMDYFESVRNTLLIKNIVRQL